MHFVWAKLNQYCDSEHVPVPQFTCLNNFSFFVTDCTHRLQYTGWSETSITTVLITVCLLTTQVIHHIGRSRAESCAWTGWTIYPPPLLMPSSQSKHLTYSQSYDIPSYLTILWPRIHSIFTLTKTNIINLLMDCDEYLTAQRLGGCFIKEKKKKSTADKLYR